MPLKNWNVVPGNNISAPPFGAPESSTKIKDFNDLIRQVMADTRYLAASSTVASAATTDLGAVDETILTISGIATITSFGTVSAGIYKLVSFSGALTLTHNATSLILLGGENRTTVAGDCGLYVSLGGGNWKEYFYSPISTSLASLTAQQATDIKSLSAFVGTLLNDIDAVTARATLGVSIATGGDITAGKVLGVGWGGLGADSGLATSDWNAATANGIIYMSDTAANPPIAGWLIGTYHRHNSTHGTQFLATFQGTAPRQFVRSNVAGVWQAWREVINYSIDATAERSATENGFQRLPGGLIIQWGIASVGNGVELAVNFPVAFATGAIRVMTSHHGTVAGVNTVGRPLSLTQCGLSHNHTGPADVSFIVTGF